MSRDPVQVALLRLRNLDAQTAAIRDAEGALGEPVGVGRRLGGKAIGRMGPPCPVAGHNHRSCWQRRDGGVLTCPQTCGHALCRAWREACVAWDRRQLLAAGDSHERG